MTHSVIVWRSAACMSTTSAVPYGPSIFPRFSPIFIPFENPSFARRIRTTVSGGNASGVNGILRFVNSRSRTLTSDTYFSTFNWCVAQNARAIRYGSSPSYTLTFTLRDLVIAISSTSKGFRWRFVVLNADLYHSLNFSSYSSTSYWLYVRPREYARVAPRVSRNSRTTSASLRALVIRSAKAC